MPLQVKLLLKDMDLALMEALPLKIFQIHTVLGLKTGFLRLILQKELTFIHY